MKKAFTLIELLVVVLIIGILSAIALPQYRLAVAKSKFANMYSVAKTYVRAAEVYRVETGEWPASFDVLAIDMPGGSTVDTPMANTCATNNSMYCCVGIHSDGYQDAGIVCGDTNYQYAYEYKHVDKGNYCIAKADTFAEQLCKSIGGTFHRPFNLPAPTGHKTGYKHYSFPGF